VRVPYQDKPALALRHNAAIHTEKVLCAVRCALRAVRCALRAVHQFLCSLGVWFGQVMQRTTIQERKKRIAQKTRYVCVWYAWNALCSMRMQILVCVFLYSCVCIPVLFLSGP
jgi:hypothetical protein